MTHTAHISVEVKRPQVHVNEGRGHHYVRIADARQSVVKAPRPVILTQKVVGCKIAFGGQQGPAGPVAQARLVRLGEDLAAHQAIYIADDGLAYAADATMGVGIHALVGILLEAGMTSELRTVQTQGPLAVPGASFTPNAPIILAAAGSLIQGKPAGLGWHAPLGRALGADIFEIDIQTPIERLL